MMIRQARCDFRPGPKHNPVRLQCFPCMCKRSRAEARDRCLLSLEVRCYQPTDESVSHPAMVASVAEHAVSVA